jgi:thiol-disulfide isomerase/thioredoxin
MNRRHFSTALLAALGTSACQGDNAHSLIGNQLPVIKGFYTDGSGLDLTEIAKPAIIRFWGMWCGPCMIDMPNWESVVRQVRAPENGIANINIFTIHVGLPPANGPTLLQWVAEQQSDVRTPVVDDATNRIMTAVGIQGTPSTIYVDKNGRICEHAWQFKNERGVDSFIRKVKKLHEKA